MSLSIIESRIRKYFPEEAEEILASLTYPYPKGGGPNSNVLL